jgi:hypothetical protein
MKKTLIILLIGLNLVACKSRDEKLTKEEWILESKHITYNVATDIESDTTTFYKKSDRELVLQFHLDGNVVVTEKNNTKYGDAAWQWTDKNELKMSVDGIDLNYRISLNKKKLCISSTDLDKNTTVYMVLRQASDNDRIKDVMVDYMNKKP